MFIDLTRHGGDRALRVAAAAIAYLDDAGDSTAVHLMGGQSLRVAEPISTIEDRIAAVHGAVLEATSVSSTTSLDALAAIKSTIACADLPPMLPFRNEGTASQVPSGPRPGRKPR